MAERDEQMTMDQILSGDGEETKAPPAPDLDVSAEQMSPDERDIANYEAQQAEAKAATPDPEPAKPEPEQPAQAAQPDGASEAPADVPPFMTPEYLERHPKDPQHWSTLRKARKAAEEGWKAEAERVKALEAELQALKATAAQPQPQPAPVAPQPTQHEHPQPTPEMTMEEMAWSAKADISEANALRQFGQEKVDQAFAWFQQQSRVNPGVLHTMRAQLDPWGWVVSEMDRHSMLSRIGDDPAAFEARIREEERNRLMAEQAGDRAAEAEKAEAEARQRAEQEIQSRIPSSLANIPNASPNSSTNGQWTGPATMSDILKSPLDNR